jgi:hypothetical protein
VPHLVSLRDRWPLIPALELDGSWTDLEHIFSAFLSSSSVGCILWPEFRLQKWSVLCGLVAGTRNHRASWDIGKRELDGPKAVSEWTCIPKRKERRKMGREI